MGYQLYCELPLTTVMSEGLSAAVIFPSAFRSANCWNISMAVGCTAFPPTVFGLVKPRAKPICSQARVTPTHAPAPFRYSTRNHPSISGQGFPAVGVQAPVG